ncbi:hybrid sensor histidine kinase/response regulator [Flavisolibacter nicotianae]|uniref:hybrid sensor histidine kinase/response regulator n=1 Tax=Flavisolibacter nicotianae TaxID=2364882 RepID=UPI000EAF3010|nr:PAS domain S-box protein [Flavisolibacter nicotianae]
MNAKYRVLHLEDVRSDAELVARELRKSLDFDHLVIDSEKAYLKALEQFCPDVILCDHSLPSFNSLEALKIVKQKKLHIPFILITATMSEDVAAGVVREGADDYILKDRLKRLPNAVLNAIEKYRHEKERKALIDEVHQKDVQTTKRLLELSTKLLLATQVAGIGIWEYRLQTGKFVADDVLFSLYGITASDFDGSYEAWMQFIHPEDKERVHREFQNALTTTEDFDMVFRIIRHDQSVHFIKAVALVENNAEGNPVRLIGTNHDITAAKEAEKVVAENEAKYRSIFENSLDAILLTVADGYILAANPAACAIFKMTEQQIIDKGRFGIVDVTDPRLPVLLEERRRTGKAKGVTNFVRSDGSTFPGEVSSVVFTDAHGEARTSMVIRDISERKKMEKALENERLRYFEVFQQAPSAIAILKGADHRFEMANPYYLQLMGKKDVIGKTAREVFPEVEGQGFFELLDQVFRGGNCFTGKEMLVKLNRCNGGQLEDCYLNFIFQPYRNDIGETEGIFFFGNDVTEQVASRKKIEASEKQFRQIVETAQEGIWMLDEKNLTQFVNAKMCRILGYSEKEMMGKPPHFFVKTKGKKPGLHTFSAGMNSIIDMYEDQFVTKSGTVVWAHLSTNPIVDDNGNYRGALAMVTDITVRKRLEEKIMRQKVQQQKEITKATLLVQEKERNFLGSELHDNINQILTAVKLQLKHYLENPDASKEIVTSSHAYLEMAIEEIRKLSQRLVTHRFDEDSFTDAIRFLIKGLSIEKIVALDVEGLNEDAIHESIKLTVFRIVQEHLNNISKYAKATEVTITLSNDTKEVSLQICDNGIGFNTKEKRAGVGLTNIYNRVESYNGSIHIKSAPGQGCNLQLWIPLDQPLSLHN